MKSLRFFHDSGIKLSLIPVVNPYFTDQYTSILLIDDQYRNRHVSTLVTYAELIKLRDMLNEHIAEYGKATDEPSWMPEDVQKLESPIRDIPDTVRGRQYRSPDSNVGQPYVDVTHRRKS